MISNQITVWSDNLSSVQGYLTHLVDSGRKIHIEVEEIPTLKNKSGFIFTYQTINILASEEDFTAEDLEMANNYSGTGKEEPQDDKGFFYLWCRAIPIPVKCCMRHEEIWMVQIQKCGRSYTHLFRSTS